MKKGFTMIELIFVIVILGILASVAIPRLASTREDAEISAAIANLRTLQSDVSAYYVVKGSFGTSKYKEFTNVPLKTADGAVIADTVQAVSTTANAYLPVGDAKTCIGLHLVEKNPTTKAPAYIQFTKGTATGICSQVLNAPAVKAFVDNTIRYGTNQTVANAVAIGSNTEVYPSVTTPNPNPNPAP